MDWRKAVGEYRKLFEPTTIGHIQLKNRIVFPATATHLANKDGTVSQQQIDFYARRARGGVGMIVVEYCEIDRQQQASTGAIQIWDDIFVEGLSRLADCVKSYGTAVAIQLHHPGRMSDTRIIGVQGVAPSPIPSILLRETPRELSHDEVWEIIDKFVDGIGRAKKAGFDAVEFHGASGYLIHQFLSPLTNRRQDAWGGSTEKRCKFLSEIIKRGKAKVGREFPLILRLAVEDYIDGGLHIEESKRIVTIMGKEGIDAISVTAGILDSPIPALVPPMFMSPGCHADLAAEIKQIARTPVMVAGRLGNPNLAEKVLIEQKADLICICRALLVDPDMPKKALEGNYTKIHRCIADNTCVDYITKGVPGGRLLCLLNPEVGREGCPENQSDQPKRVMVIGGGPAGLEAARVAGLRGHTVALLDENAELGGRWSWMIKPYILDRLKILHNLGVDVQLGRPLSLGVIEEWAPDVMIATKRLIPANRETCGIIVDGSNFCTADEVFSRKVNPEGRLIVIEGNNIGLEVAELLSKLGQSVTILEKKWVGRGTVRVNRNMLLERLSQKGIKFQLFKEITSICNNKLLYKDKGNREQSIEADWFVLASYADIDNDSVVWLMDRQFEVLPINPIQSPRDWPDAFEEGCSVARQI
ncbi:FAD-dependent oxidoreductase [Chloroflexota bacterium]